jgi:hypothetical protein
LFFLGLHIHNHLNFHPYFTFCYFHSTLWLILFYFHLPHIRAAANRICCEQDTASQYCIFFDVSSQQVPELHSKPEAECRPKIRRIAISEGHPKWIRAGDAEAELPMVPESCCIFAWDFRIHRRVLRRKMLYDPRLMMSQTTNSF